jgi:hypothetical protein
MAYIKIEHSHELILVLVEVTIEVAGNDQANNSEITYGESSLSNLIEPNAHYIVCQSPNTFMVRASCFYESADGHARGGVSQMV